MDSKVINFIDNMVSGITKSTQYNSLFYHNIRIELQTSFNISEKAARKYRDKYFLDKPMALYWFLNGEDLFLKAKEYEKALTRKNIKINDSLFLKMLDKAKLINKDTEESYKAFFILDFISEKLD